MATGSASSSAFRFRAGVSARPWPKAAEERKKRVPPRYHSSPGRRAWRFFPDAFSEYFESFLIHHRIALDDHVLMGE